MCEMCCQCEWEIGQTVIGEMADQGLKCLKCHKMISWLPEELDEEHDPAAADQRSLDEITEDLIEMGGTGGLFGDAAFSCNHCHELTFWKGPSDLLQEMVDDIVDSDWIDCPSCGAFNEITDKVKEMLR